MKIDPSFKIKDEASGIEVSVILGTHLNKLQIKHICEPAVKNRDFYFTKEGKFDGTVYCLED